MRGQGEDIRKRGRRWLLVAGVTVAMSAAACSDTSESAPEGAAPALEELDGQRLICARTSQVGADGEREGREEFYHLDRMQSLLREDHALRDALGFDAVTDCQQARLFARTERALNERRPDRPRLRALGGSIPLDQSLAEAALRVPLPRNSDKILNGTAVDNLSFVAVKNYTDFQPVIERCSGVPFGLRQWQGAWITDILTAAHCASSDGVKDFEILMTNPSGGTAFSVGHFFTGVARNPGYTGSGDSGDDIAILSVLGLNWNGGMNDLSFGNMTKSTEMFAFGFGLSSVPGDPLKPVGRTGKGGGGFQADFIAQDYFSDKNDAEVNLCEGDSGGPARLGPLFPAIPKVVGVASEIESFDGACRAPGFNQYWVRVGFHTDWIQNMRGPCVTMPNAVMRCF